MQITIDNDRIPDSGHPEFALLEVGYAGIQFDGPFLSLFLKDANRRGRAVHRRFRLFQGHASPGVYARAFLEGRLSRERLENFRYKKGKTST